MRIRTVAPLMVFALSCASAMAQDTGPGPAPKAPEHERWLMDFGAGASLRVGVGYAFSDTLSIRPSLGLGYSTFGGFFFVTGAEMRRQFRPDARLSPFAGLAGKYFHGRTEAREPSEMAGPYRRHDGVQLGVVGGLRFHISRRFSLFGETRLLHDTFDWNQSGTGHWNLDARNHVDVAAGLTLRLK